MAEIPEIDWGHYGRVDSYEVWTVDPFTLSEVAKVDFDASGSKVTWAYYTDTKATASIAVVDALAKDSMLRVKHTVNVGGVDYSEVMGTFFASSKSMDAVSGRISRSMDCYSALLRHQKDYLMTVHNYVPGDNVSGIIKEIVEADGGQVYFEQDAPTDRVHTMDMHWDIGQNKLEMINLLAGWINGQIGVTDYGQISLARYRAPSDKPVSWTFEAGANCIYLPGISTSEDEGDVYNRVICYYSTDEGEASYTATLDPAHPYSYERIGRHVTETIELNEVAEQSELESKAIGSLEEHCGGAIYYSIEHAGIPNLRPGMVVRYVNEEDYTSRIDARCLITEMSVDALSPMCMTKTKMRTVG